MAITYTQSSALISDAAFVGRVRVAVLKFGSAITDEAASVSPDTAALSQKRKTWAFKALADSDAMAQKVTPTTVLDPAVQQDGSATTDASLQAAVEAAIARLNYLNPPTF